MLMRTYMRSGFLCDDAGLGKTITTVLAALNAQLENLGSVPILAVTKKACLLQWHSDVQQLQKPDAICPALIHPCHLYTYTSPRGQSPRCQIIKDDEKDASSTVIMQHDIIITSHDFLVSNYSEMKLSENFYRAVRLEGLETARQKLGKRAQTLHFTAPCTKHWTRDSAWST